MTYLEELDMFPPILCRILARHSGQGKYSVPMTIKEISDRSGLGLGRTKWISRLESWATVPVGDAEKFMEGCGVTRDTRLTHRLFLKRQYRTPVPLAFLSQLRSRERRRINKLLENL